MTLRTTFCQEQEPSLESAVSAILVQLPGTVFRTNYTISLTLTRSENGSRAYYLIVLIRDFLYYGLEACPLRKSQYNSIDYVINSSFRKAFDTKSQEVIDVCLLFRHV